MRKLYRFFCSARLAIVLLVYLGLFSIVGTFIPQTGQGIESPINAFLEVPLVASIVARLGLHDAFSTPFFVIPVLLLLLNTCACTIKRIQTARARQALVRSIQDFVKNTDSTVSDDEKNVDYLFMNKGKALGIEDSDGSLSSDTRYRIAGTLRGLMFKKIQEGQNIVWGSTSLWTLFASPVFHILLVVILVVIFGGRINRLEAMLVAQPGVSYSLTEENLSVQSRGVWYRFSSAPKTLTVLSIENDYVLDGQARGSAADIVIKDSGGRVIKSQVTYVNRPLTYGSHMIHAYDVGLSARFERYSVDNVKLQSITEPINLSGDDLEMIAENAAHVFLPIRIEIQDEEGSYFVFHLMPDIVDGAIVPGNKIDAYGLVTLTDSEMNPLVESEVIEVGQSYPLPDGGYMRFVGVDEAVSLLIADDWSVLPLYILSTMAIIALAVALLASPRLCAVWYDEARGEFRYLARFYRPHALDSAQVAQALTKSLSQGDNDQRQERG